MTNLKFSLSSRSMDRISHSPLSMAGAHSTFFLHHAPKLTSRPTVSRSSFFSLSLSTKNWSDVLSLFRLSLWDQGLIWVQREMGRDRWQLMLIQWNPHQRRLRQRRRLLNLNRNQSRSRLLNHHIRSDQRVKTIEENPRRSQDSIRETEIPVVVRVPFS